MSGRPRTARGATGRDGGKESDIEADLLARIVESVKKAKDANDNAQRAGREIMALEEDIKSAGGTSRLNLCLELMLKEDRAVTRSTSSSRWSLQRQDEIC